MGFSDFAAPCLEKFKQVAAMKLVDGVVVVIVVSGIETYLRNRREKVHKKDYSSFDSHSLLFADGSGLSDGQHPAEEGLVAG